MSFFLFEKDKRAEFVNVFRRGGEFCFDDWRLAGLVDQARDVLSGLSTDKLRQDGNLRKYIADEMDQLRVAVDGALEDLPRRKIRMAA